MVPSLNLTVLIILKSTAELQALSNISSNPENSKYNPENGKYLLTFSSIFICKNILGEKIYIYLAWKFWTDSDYINRQTLNGISEITFNNAVIFVRSRFKLKTETFL